MGSAERLMQRPAWLPIPRLTPGAFMGTGATGCVAADTPRPIQARSVSDGIGRTFDATPCVASDPPAHAGGFYGDGEEGIAS
jgi:hypothetical protein